MNKIKNILKSKVFKIIMIVFGSLFVASFIFQAGMIAGFKKASFGRDWGDNYIKNFGRLEMGPRMMNGKFDNFGDLPIAHGEGQYVADEKERVLMIITNIQAGLPVMCP